MFKLTTSNNTHVPKRPVREGYPDHEATIPDICIINQTNYNSAIILNSKMLRQALLADTEVTKQLLGIEVSDIHAPKAPRTLTVKKKTSPRTSLKPITEELKEDSNE